MQTWIARHTKRRRQRCEPSSTWSAICGPISAGCIPIGRHRSPDPLFPLVRPLRNRACRNQPVDSNRVRPQIAPNTKARDSPAISLHPPVIAEEETASSPQSPPPGVCRNTDRSRDSFHRMHLMIPCLLLPILKNGNLLPERVEDCQGYHANDWADRIGSSLKG